MSGDKGPRRVGVALLATADDPETATEWQEALTAKGIMSVLRGHRNERDDDAFHGVDVLVPSSVLHQAREVLGPSVIRQVDDEPTFPWLWLALGPLLFFGTIVILVILLI